MARYALIKGSSFLGLRDFDAKPADVAGKGQKWLRCDPITPPSIDPLTEIVEGPSYTINEADVTESWTSRSLTAQEISDSKTAAISAINGSRSPILRAFYNVDKRLRVLEGSNAITFVQFKAGLPSVLP